MVCFACIGRAAVNHEPPLHAPCPRELVFWMGWDHCVYDILEHYVLDSVFVLPAFRDVEQLVGVKLAAVLFYKACYVRSPYRIKIPVDRFLVLPYTAYEVITGL
jgi:hypothetical protein